MGLFEEIIDEKFSEADALKEASTREAIDRSLETAPPVRRFDLALVSEDGNVAIIAEMKRYSPSHKDIDPELDVADAANSYQRGGASALSVLTDRRNFHGSLDDLKAARQVAEVPVLRKDFTVDPLQLCQARGAGADAALVVVATLKQNGHLLSDLQATADRLGMTTVIEVGNDDDLDLALEMGPRVLGVNNRDLRKLTDGNDAIDLRTAERLISRVPNNVVTIAMSGMKSTQDIRRMADAGFNAVLIGELLVKKADKQAAVRELTTIRRTRKPELV